MPKITLNNYELEVVEQLKYLGYTISSNFSLDRELHRIISRTASTFARLGSCVWKIPTQ